MYFSEIETIAYHRTPAIPKPSSEAERPLAEIAWSALPEKVRRTIRTAGALSLEGDYPDSRKIEKIETEVAVFSGNGKSVRLVARDRRAFEAIEDHVVHRRVAAVFQALEAAIVADGIGDTAGKTQLGDLPEPPELPVVPSWLESIEFASRPSKPADFESVLARGTEAAEALRHVIQWAADDPDAAIALPEDYTLLIHAFLLLGDLHDKASFAPIVRFVSTPQSICDQALGDLITEELPEILTRTYNGDFALIAGLIENEDAYIYCRRSAVGALTHLFWDDVLPRELVAGYLGDLLRRADVLANYELCGSLVNAVADLQFEELAEPVQRAFEQDALDRGEIDESTFLSILKDEKSPYRHISPNEPLWSFHLNCYWLTTKFLTDQARSSRWHRLKGEEEQKRGQQQSGAGTTSRVFIKATPYVAPQKPGRNDPCSCGSGKKYKKCCGAAG